MILFSAVEFYDYRLNYKAVIQSNKTKIETPIPFTSRFINGINPFPLFNVMSSSLRAFYG